MRGRAPRLIAYADDLAVTNSGCCLNSMSEIIARKWRLTYNWTREVGFDINSEETDQDFFSRNYT